MTSLVKINSVIEKVSNFLTPLLPIVRCHMVDYLTMTHWDTLLPLQLQKDLLSLPKEQLHLIPSASLQEESGSSFNSQDWNFATSDLSSFLASVRSHCLPNLDILTTVEEVLCHCGCIYEKNSPVKGIMSEKKSHEVEVMGQVVSQLAKGRGVNWVLDLGSGRGYLSSSLVLQHGLNVIAVDSCESNTVSGLVRNKKLEKRWNHLKQNQICAAPGKQIKKRKTKRASANNEITMNKEEKSNEVFDTQNVSKGKYFGMTRFVTDDVDVMHIIKEIQDKQDGPSLSTNTTSNEVPETVYKKNQTNAVEVLFPGTEGDTIPSTVETSTQEQLSVQNCFGITDDERLGLVGLHTCGNLASSSLKIFLANSKLDFICNVGCCYHLIDEEFSKNTYNQIKPDKTFVPHDAAKTDSTIESSTQSCGAKDSMKPSKPQEGVTAKHHSVEELDNSTIKGFPLCSVLKDGKFSLGRNSRNLSCQAADRLTTKGPFSGTEALYWRALLQVLLKDKLGDVSHIKNVGRISAKCKNFTDYARVAIAKLKVSIIVTDEELMEYYTKYLDNLKKIECFFLLRAALAQVIEGLILLDRIAFLCEQNETVSAFLVQLFDPVISPRCYAVIALKQPRSCHIN